MHLEVPCCPGLSCYSMYWEEDESLWSWCSRLMMGIVGLYVFRSTVLLDSGTSGPMKLGGEVVEETTSPCMEVTLAVTHYFGDMNPERANSCIQKKKPSGAIDTPTHPQSFQSKICLVYKKWRDKYGAETVGMASQLAKLETHLMGKHQSLKLLMMPCYACK